MNEEVIKKMVAFLIDTEKGGSKVHVTDIKMVRVTHGNDTVDGTMEEWHEAVKRVMDRNE